MRSHLSRGGLPWRNGDSKTPRGMIPAYSSDPNERKHEMINQSADSAANSILHGDTVLVHRPAVEFNAERACTADSKRSDSRWNSASTQHFLTMRNTTTISRIPRDTMSV